MNHTQKHSLDSLDQQGSLRPQALPFSELLKNSQNHIPSCQRPLHIALEGVKGAGKSTSLSIIKEKLRERGIKVFMMCPTAPAPTYYWTEWMSKLPYLKNHDKILEILYAKRSEYTAHQVMKQRLAQGEEDRYTQPSVILGDRSFYTSLVTRWRRVASIGVEAHWNETRRLEPSIPLPDVVFYLDAPLELLKTRLAQRERSYGAHDEREDRLIEGMTAYHEIMAGVLGDRAPSQWFMCDVKDAEIHQKLSEMISHIVEHHFHVSCQSRYTA